MVVRREALVGLVVNDVDASELLDGGEAVVGRCVVDDHHVDLARPLRGERRAHGPLQQITAVVVDQHNPQPSIGADHLPNRRLPASKPR